MNEVTIVSKTYMKNAACVRGILKNGRYIRLLKSNGYNHEKDTDIDVGDVYKIDFHDKLQLSPPHVEDIIIDSISFQRKLTKKELTDYLINDLNVKVWTGEPDSLFDGKLKWTHNGG